MNSLPDYNGLVLTESGIAESDYLELENKNPEITSADIMIHEMNEKVLFMIIMNAMNKREGYMLSLLLKNEDGTDIDHDKDILHEINMVIALAQAWNKRRKSLSGESA